MGILLGSAGRRLVMKLGAPAAAVAFFHAAVLSAQEPRSAAQPTFRAEVNLVEVVAVVTGEDDRSLGDLAASDFEVLEDGSVRTLVSVRKLAADSRATATAATSSTALPAYVERLPTSTASADAPAFVLLLDDLDTSPRDSHRVIRAGERALSFIPDSALLSVLTTSGLDGSLLTLEPPGPQHLSKVKEFRGQLLLRGFTPLGLGGSPGGGGGTRMGGDCMTGTSSLDCQDPTRPARRASAVAAAAEILGRSGARRKVLIWVAQTMGVSTIDPQGSRAAQRRALASALNNDITVYVLDPRENPGIDDPPDTKRTGGALEVGGSAMALDVDDMAAVPLTQLTRETGGRYITMANNLGDFMGRIIEQNSTAYLLVYESPVSRTPGRHRIEVRVKRQGARVSARRGYIVEPPAPGESPSTAPDDDLLRRTLLGSAPQGQLRLTVQAVPRFAQGKTGSVSVTVLANGGDEPLALPVDIVIATFDDEGRATNQHQVRLDPPPAGQPLEFTTELPLARGRHQLRVAAVTGDATKTGLVITPVEVIEPGRQLMIAPPIVLQRVGQQVTPTAARRFVAGAPLGVQVEIAGRPVQEGKVVVRISLADSAGAVVRTADALLDAGESADRQRATALVETTGLHAGAHLLTIEAVPPKAGEAVRHALPIHLDAATSTAASPRHLVVAHGPSSRHPEAGTFVIRTEEEWRTFWSHLPTRQAAPPIDFGRATLFAVIGGGSDAPAGKPVVVSVNDEGDQTVVLWRTEPDTSPTEGNPFTVVAMPRAIHGPVRFERQP